MWTPKGYQQVTGLSSAKSLTVPAGATRAAVVATGQPVRWRQDGTAPTASIGMYIAVGVERVFEGSLSKLQFIETTASAVLNVQYYG